MMTEALSMMSYTCNPSTRKVKAGGSRGDVQEQLRLYSEFKASLRYMKLCLNNKNRKIE